MKWLCTNEHQNTLKHTSHIHKCITAHWNHLFRQNKLILTALSVALSLLHTHTHTHWLTRAVTSINSPILPLLPQCLEVGFCPVFSTLTPELSFFVTRNENVPKSQSVSIAVWESLWDFSVCVSVYGIFQAVYLKEKCVIFLLIPLLLLSFFCGTQKEKFWRMWFNQTVLVTPDINCMDKKRLRNFSKRLRFWSTEETYILMFVWTIPLIPSIERKLFVFPSVCVCICLLIWVLICEQ